MLPSQGGLEEKKIESKIQGGDRLFEWVRLHEPRARFSNVGSVEAFGARALKELETLARPFCNSTWYLDVTSHFDVLVWSLYTGPKYKIVERRNRETIVYSDGDTKHSGLCRCPHQSGMWGKNYLLECSKKIVYCGERAAICGTNVLKNYHLFWFLSDSYDHTAVRRSREEKREIVGVWGGGGGAHLLLSDASINPTGPRLGFLS